MDLERQLSALLPGREIHWLSETASTNGELRTLCRSGAKAGTVVLAESQTAGRGRMGRSFFSPAGTGLYLSLLLRPELPPERLPVLPALAAVAIRRAIRQETGLYTEIKWVNDLYAHGRKLCGILAEGIFSGSRMEGVILGVGLNCNTPSDGFPPELRQLATSIQAETGIFADRVSLSAAILRELDKLPLSDPAAFLPEYREACLTLQKQVTLPDGTAGLATGLTEEYGLIVETDGGTVILRSGEATLHGQSVDGRCASP